MRCAGKGPGLNYWQTSEPSGGLVDSREGFHTMRIRIVVGLLLVAAGMFFLVRGWSYTSERKVLELGEFKASVEEKRAVPPWIGGVVIIAGVLLATSGRWHRRGT